MKLYFAHSSGFDYQKEWYDIIRESSLFTEHECIFPHESREVLLNSREVIKSCDCVIAEVSFPSLGTGIELGWADVCGIPILCCHTVATKPSSSLKTVTQEIHPYSSSEELIQVTSDFVSQQSTI